MATRAIVSARRGFRDGLSSIQERTGPCRESCTRQAAECEKAVGRVVSLRLLYFWGAALTAGVAGLLFVLGLGVPPAMADALKQEIRASVIATDRVPMATALTGGKVIPETYSYTVLEFFNFELSLSSGDHPVADVVGPVAYEVQHTHHERNRLDEVMQYKRRSTRSLDSSGTNSGNAGRAMYLPNPAWHTMLGYFKRNPLVVDWEDAGVPMLASMALHQMKASGPEAIKRILWSNVVGGWYDETVTRVYQGDHDTFVAHFISSDRSALILQGYAAGVQMNEPSNDFDFMVLPVASGVTGDATTQISPAIGAKLLDVTDSFSLLHHSGFGRFMTALRFFDFSLPLTPLSAHHEQVQAFAEVWVAQMSPVDRTYINNNERVMGHMAQVLAWVAELLDGRGDTGRVAKLRLQQRIANRLHQHGLIQEAEWEWVLPAQLGSNAAAGLAFWLGDTQVPVVNRQLTRMAQVTGLTLENECFRSRETDAGLTSSDHGGSLADNLLLSQQLWHDPLYYVAPEASCVLSRQQQSNPALPPENFQSKFNETEMRWLLDLFTVGPIMDGVPVPVDTSLQVNGSASIAALYFGMKDIWYDNVDRNLDSAIRLDANRTGTGLTNILLDFATQGRIMVQNNPDTAQYIAAQVRKEQLTTMYEQAAGKAEVDPLGLGTGSIINGLACRRHLEVHWGMDFQDIHLTCQQLFDIVFWLDYLAREFMLKPQFAFDDPDGVLPSQAVLKAGPVVRTTAFKYLDSGIEDPLFFRLFGFRYPGAAPPDSQDSTAWLVQYADDMESDGVDLGTLTPDKVGRMVKRNGSRSLEVWGEVTAVGGAATGWQKPPQLSRLADYGKYEEELPLWFPTLERTVMYRYAAALQDSARGLRVHRYELRESADIQWLPSDEAACRRAEVQSCRGGEVEQAPPPCLRSQQFAPSLFSPARSYADFLVGQPFLYGCDAETQELGYAWRDFVRVDRNSKGDHGSFVEYEPVVGQATRSRFREGRYVRLQPSRWYQHAPPALLQLHSLTRSRDVPAGMAAEWAADVGSRNQMIDSSIPGGCFGIGVILLISSILLLLLYKRHRAVERAKVRPPKVRSYAQVQAARQERLKEAEAALRSQDAGRKRKRADKRSSMVRKDAPVEDKQFTLEEIEKEMARLAERKEALQKAAKEGKKWAVAVSPSPARPGTAPADAEVATRRAGAPKLGDPTEADKVLAEEQLAAASVEAAGAKKGITSGLRGLFSSKDSKVAPALQRVPETVPEAPESSGQGKRP